jgi:hypothetical protein
MKVRILSGNNAGAVVEMDQTEAEVNLATGYAEAVPDEPRVVVAPKPTPVKEAKPKPEPKPEPLKE